MTYENYKKELKEIGKEFKKNGEEVKAEIADKLADNLNGNEFKIIVNTVVPVDKGFCPGKTIILKNFFGNNFREMIEDISNCRYSGLENRFGFFLKRKNGEEHYFAVWQNGRKFN